MILHLIYNFTNLFLYLGKMQKMAVPVTQKTLRRVDPNGGRLFVIGDIHGRLDKLKEMFDLIEQHPRASNDKVILLGDYSAKGPDTKGVLDFLLEQKSIDSDSVVTLMGNHDYHFATFSEDWFKSDVGKTVLKSYVDTPKTKRYESLTWVPYDNNKIRLHRKFIKSMPSMLVTKKFVFTHAGIDPTKEVWEQKPKTVMFIRDKFLNSEIDCGYTVVHGHTPTPNNKIQVTKNRINLDTSCYKTGILSCVVLDDNSGDIKEYIQTKGD